MIDVNFYTENMFTDKESYNNAMRVVKFINKLYELGPGYSIFDKQEQTIFPIDFHLRDDGVLVRSGCFVVIGCCIDDDDKIVFDSEVLQIFKDNINIIKTEEIDIEL